VALSVKFHAKIMDDLFIINPKLGRRCRVYLASSVFDLTCRIRVTGRVSYKSIRLAGCH